MSHGSPIFDRSLTTATVWCKSARGLRGPPFLTRTRKGSRPADVKQPNRRANSDVFEQRHLSPSTAQPPLNPVGVPRRRSSAAPVKIKGMHLAQKYTHEQREAVVALVLDQGYTARATVAAAAADVHTGVYPLPGFTMPEQTAKGLAWRERRRREAAATTRAIEEGPAEAMRRMTRQIGAIIESEIADAALEPVPQRTAEPDRGCSGFCGFGPCHRHPPRQEGESRTATRSGHGATAATRSRRPPRRHVHPRIRRTRSRFARAPVFWTFTFIWLHRVLRICDTETVGFSLPTPLKTLFRGARITGAPRLFVPPQHGLSVARRRT